jgi:hypothetical protein
MQIYAGYHIVLQAVPLLESEESGGPPIWLADMITGRAGP